MKPTALQWYVLFSGFLSRVCFLVVRFVLLLFAIFIIMFQFLFNFYIYGKPCAMRFASHMHAHVCWHKVIAGILSIVLRVHACLVVATVTSISLLAFEVE